MSECRHWYTCDTQGLIFCEKCGRSCTYGDCNHLEARVAELEKENAQLAEFNSEALKEIQNDLDFLVSGEEWSAEGTRHALRRYKALLRFSNK